MRGMIGYITVKWHQAHEIKIDDVSFKISKIDFLKSDPNLKITFLFHFYALRIAV